MAKTNKMPPMAQPAAQPPMVEDTASGGDYSHIDDFLASLSEEERMYAREALAEKSDDSEFDSMVGLAKGSPTEVMEDEE